MDSVVEFMRKKWGIQNPNLILSVTGGARKFSLEKNVEQQFKKGLINVATLPQIAAKDSRNRNGGISNVIKIFV